MARAFIALGSNLQEPLKQVSTALDEIDSIENTRLIRHSSLYVTKPLGYENQPNFINAVAEVETRLDPAELLHGLFAIENSHGRERPFPNAPRVLDLDLLLYDDITMRSDELTLPHPRMHERGFVMLPLAEIAPDLKVGGLGTASGIAERCAAQGIEKLQNSQHESH